MNMLVFFIQIIVGLLYASVMALSAFIMCLIFLSRIVDFFNLNKRGNPMCVLTVCMTVLWLTWFLSFTYFIGGFK